ncbi:MAG: hypothetical protein L3J81_01795, partial [Thermoplasmata archaeon]|nr:hypothetical protein [Thermoplasmata archaeon]
PIGILVVLLVVGLGVGILIARSRGGSPPPEAPSDEGDTTWPSENPAPEESGDAAGGSVGPEPE